ncbi:MAG TPA: hypothetical protein VFM55_20500 [Micromonosporaceae bacterium]|nr:hypothetical protein [Micromonosporaceae bacterium]
MSDTDTEVRAVLDTSAMLSYARGHVHVGEILVEVAEEGAYVGLPVVALLDAYSKVHDGPGRARLGVLTALPGARVLDLGAGEAAVVSLAVGLVGGDLARAHAVWAALRHGAYYLTTQPKAAPGILTAEQVHHLPDDDA